MNWVGGSRSRIMMKNDTKKQREFFAKKKLQNKLKTLGLPTSPKRESTGSMDLVTLFIVNQIATKKSKTSQPKVTHFRDLKGPNRAKAGELIALPMSPCEPSRLPLAEVQPLHSSTPFQRERTFMKKRKPNFPLFKQPELSPVLESNMSDISASEYQHHVCDSFSPYSMASPTRLGSAGLFPSHQSSRIHTPPLHPWELTQPEASMNNPFFHPGGGREREGAHWSGDGLAGTSGHTQTTTPVTRVQFGGIETIPIESRRHDTHTGSVSFPLCVSNKNESQESFFRDFGNDEYSHQAPYGDGVIKIHLPEEAASSSTQSGAKTFMSSAVDLGGIVESQQRDGEQDLVGKVFTCEDSRHGVGHEQLSERSESSSYSPREAYDSDSEDEDEDCSCQHNTNTRKSVEDTPFENSEHRDRMGTTISQATPFSPITQPSLSRDQQLWNSADKVRTAHCMSSCPVPGADSARNHGSCWYGEDQYVPGDTQWPDSRRAEPPAAVPPPVPALEPQTREVGTQTTPVTRPSLTDASTQWIPPLDVRNTATDTEEHHQPPSGPTPCTPAAPPRFTRGQHKHAHKRQEPLRCWQASSSSPAPSHTHRHTHTHTHNQERNAPWKARGGAHTHTHISVPTPEWRSGPAPAAVHSAAAPVADPVHTWAHQHRQPVRQPCVVDIIQPPTPVLGGGGRTSPLQHAEEVRREQASVLGGEEDRRGGDRRVAPERQEQEWCENLPLSEARARARAGARDGEEAVVVVVAEQEERGVKSVSEEAETLQEIADILVMMKRRKKNQ